ncbi:hypothetical protein HY463_00690 [Candidatus Peregrinibacteria bacterium]|nr:hypothetical protein [Candidatus Peregrinibacteria bacterium]
MSRVDQIKTANDSANPESLPQDAAILGVQEDTKEQVATATETIEVDPRLTKFAEMYKKWSATSKRRLDWSRVQAAMLADDGALLKKVEALPNGPIMFGADKAGNILFANGGLEPILTDKNYWATMDAARTIGLEFFPATDSHRKSEEERMFEVFTGEPLVRSEDKTTWRSSWLELEEIGSRVHYAPVSSFLPTLGKSYTRVVFASSADEFRGIRGLLRAKA